MQFTNDNLAPGRSPDSQNHRLSVVARAGVGNNPLADAIFNNQLVDGSLAEGQVGLIFNGQFHLTVVGVLISLGPQCADCRTLPGIQHPHLDIGLVNVMAHLTTQGINFPNHNSLGGATDGWVTWHKGDHVQIDGDQQGLIPHPGSG